LIVVISPVSSNLTKLERKAISWKLKPAKIQLNYTYTVTSLEICAIASQY